MRTFNIIKNIILFELIGLFAIFLVLYYYRITQPIDSGINYNNNTLSVINPERGFYYPLSHNFDTTSSDPLWTVSQLEKYSEEVSIFHLRFGLECYSTKAGGEDANISAATLQALSLTFENIRQVNATAIIRFSYDRNGSITESGNLDFEPSLDLIETHISQLGTIISQNLDVVSYIESGMFGPWGEQNKTKITID